MSSQPFREKKNISIALQVDHYRYFITDLIIIHYMTEMHDNRYTCTCSMLFIDHIDIHITQALDHQRHFFSFITIEIWPSG